MSNSASAARRARTARTRRALSRPPVHEDRAGRSSSACRTKVAEEEHHKLPRQPQRRSRSSRSRTASRSRVRVRSASARRAHEVESWMPGRDDGRAPGSETHSCSTMGDFQARCSNIRPQDAGRLHDVPVHHSTTPPSRPDILIPLRSREPPAGDGSIKARRPRVPLHERRRGLARGAERDGYSSRSSSAEPEGDGAGSAVAA